MDLEFVQLQKSKTDQAEFIYALWKPDTCPKSDSEDGACNVQLKRDRTRRRYFDFPLPGKLNVRDLYCATHRSTFNYLHMIDSLPDTVHVKPDIVLRKRKYHRS